MSERIDLTHDMGHASIGKLILQMSIPSTIGVMAYNVYNLFDTIFISQGAGMDAMGSVAVSFPLFLFLSAISSTLGGARLRSYPAPLGKMTGSGPQKRREIPWDCSI